MQRCYFIQPPCTRHNIRRVCRPVYGLGAADRVKRQALVLINGSEQLVHHALLWVTL